MDYSHLSSPESSCSCHGFPWINIPKKKKPKPLNAQSKQLLRWEAVSPGRTAAPCQGSPSKGRSLTSCWSLFSCLYIPAPSAWSTPNPKICFLKCAQVLSSLLPGSCCFVFPEERAALIPVYGSGCPKSRQIIPRKTFCFQVSTHGNKQAKWREKQNF